MSTPSPIPNFGVTVHPDVICGNKEYIQFVQPQVERAMQTYSGIKRVPTDDPKEEFMRERMNAAMSLLERIIGQDLENELAMEMERQEEKEYHRKQNLMMAGSALERIRSENGHLLETDFSVFPSERKIYKTPYGMFMLGVKEVLEKFWTGE